jgi:hypothetical protein
VAPLFDAESHRDQTATPQIREKVGACSFVLGQMKVEKHSKDEIIHDDRDKGPSSQLL